MIMKHMVYMTVSDPSLHVKPLFKLKEEISHLLCLGSLKIGIEAQDLISFHKGTQKQHMSR